MSWWEIVAMFGGIPIAVCVSVGGLVYWLTESRLPDGLAAARSHDEAESAAPTVHDDPRAATPVDDPADGAEDADEPEGGDGREL